MTEQVWFRCTQPWGLLGHIGAGAGGWVYRPFACAAARQAWELFPDPRSRAAVERAEQYAVGLADEAELALAREGAEAAEGPARAALEAAEDELRDAQALARNASSASVAARDAAVRAARDAVRAARGVLSACAFAAPYAGEVVGREITDQARPGHPRHPPTRGPAHPGRRPGRGRLRGRGGPPPPPRARPSCLRLLGARRGPALRGARVNPPQVVVS
jgi:hypothetical protein